ncbi:MAG: hypothetical protein IJX72_01825, partial [Clostridia bacterium]|nr:hypothetical protein [Clostridia bacterium]
MKHERMIRIGKLFLPALLVTLILCVCVSCNQERIPAESDTIPDTIETIPQASGDTEPETEAVTAPTVTSVKFPASRLPDYEKYATATRIKEVLGSRTTYAVTVGGKKYYANGELKAGGDGIVTMNADGTVTLDAAKLGALVGKSDLQGSTPEEI